MLATTSSKPAGAPTSAGQRPHLCAARERQDLPAEHRAVEGARALHVAGAEAVEGQGARLVDDLRALVLLRLPDEERRALGIREHRHPPGVHDVEGVHQRLAARLEDLRSGVVGALDPDVGVPHGHRRRAVRDRADGGDVPAANSRDEVLALGPRRHHVLELPAEEPAVEADGGVGIWLAGVDPARDAGEVSVSLGHCCSFRRFQLAAA
jgi:hypothetical protein